MTGGCKLLSSSTTLELKFISDKNLCHDACFALLCCGATMFLDLPYGSFSFIILTTLLCISLLAMVVNLIFAKAIEFGQAKIIRDLCATKAVHCFLRLHCLTTQRVRSILKQIDLGVEMRMGAVDSISFRSFNEFDLMEIFTDNLMYAYGYAFMWLVLVPITRSGYFDEQFGVRFGIKCERISYCIALSAAPNGLMALAVKLGHCDLTRGLCSMEPVSFYLMLHYHTHNRVRLVLQKLERERQDRLSRIKVAKMINQRIGEVIAFEKGIYNGYRCTICSGEFKKSDMVRIVRKCKHCFHADCFMRLLCQELKTCPICKVVLV